MTIETGTLWARLEAFLARVMQNSPGRVTQGITSVNSSSTRSNADKMVLDESIVIVTRWEEVREFGGNSTRLDE